MSLPALLILLFLPSGSAADVAPNAPTWRWSPGQERTWYIESRVILPTPWDLQGRGAIDAVTADLETRTLLRCAPAEGWSEGDRTVALDCAIDDIAISAGAVQGDRDELQTILEEMDADLTGAYLQVRLSPDGQLGLVDLEGIEVNDQRDAQRLETMRLLMLRAVSGLDLPLPGTAEASRWKQRGGRIAEYPSPYGTQSFAKLVHASAPASDATLAVHSEGDTSMRVQLTLQGGEAVNYLVTGGLGSESAFDVDGGALVARCWYLNADTTVNASDYQAAFALDEQGRVAWRSYVQAGTLVLLTPDRAPPEVGETGVDRFAWPGPLEEAERWQTRGATSLAKGDTAANRP